jgi:hypothetical protein
MDALVKAALDRVNQTVNNIPELNLKTTGAVSIYRDRTREISDAVRAVDALKSALKTLR